MPFNKGLSSPAVRFAGSNGANRRGRTGCAIELIDRDTRVVPKYATRGLTALLPRDMICFECCTNTAAMSGEVEVDVAFEKWVWIRLRLHLWYLEHDVVDINLNRPLQGLI